MVSGLTNVYPLIFQWNTPENFCSFSESGQISGHSCAGKRHLSYQASKLADPFDLPIKKFKNTKAANSPYCGYKTSRVTASNVVLSRGSQIYGFCRSNDFQLADP
jgi:hypothetical protein